MLAAAARALTAAHARDRSPNAPDVSSLTSQAHASGSPLASPEPYPIEAAGWGPPTTNFFLSRAG